MAAWELVCLFTSRRVLRAERVQLIVRQAVLAITAAAYGYLPYLPSIGHPQASFYRLCAFFLSYLLGDYFNSCSSDTLMDKSVIASCFRSVLKQNISDMLFAVLHDDALSDEAVSRHQVAAYECARCTYSPRRAREVLFMIGASCAEAVPLLVGTEGGAQILERLPLTPEGKGAYYEAWLQRLIHEIPACLPIAEIEPALDSFSSICREMPTQRGFVDNLLMTGRGDIALVEAKLFRNPEARRQALAQALDYATCLFSMGYADFEKAALGGNYAPRPKPACLYEALPEADKFPESTFVDAVSRNLRQGRVLILVVGDGIRSEAEAMLEGLRAHVRFGFTLALVELALFRMPEPDQRLLVRPTTIAKTAITRRTIIETTASGLIVGAREETLAVPETLSSEIYWDALDAKVPGAWKALQRLIQSAETLGVYPEFLKSLNLKWDSPGGKTVNLGYIDRRPSSPTIWTDVAAATAPRDLAHAYVQDLAATWHCDVHTLPVSGTWSLYEDDRALRLSSVLDRLDDWLGPIQRFISAIAKHDEGS